MGNEIKRVNYFNRQFLRAAEFQDDQSYHMGLRRLHNQSLHTPGVVFGLIVGVDERIGKLTISKGMAIDVLGREVLLHNDTTISLKTIKDGDNVYIKYGEKFTELSSDPGVKNIPTRCEEISEIICTEADLTEENAVLLAKMGMDSGKLTADNSVRADAGSIISDSSDLTVHSLVFKRNPTAADGLPRFISEEKSVLSLEASKYLIKGEGDKPTQLVLQNSGEGEDASIFISAQKSQERFLKFGIDVLQNKAVVDVGAEASELSFRHQGKGAMTFSTGNVERMRIDDAGNVGIGTDAPDDKLDIEGDIRINKRTLWLRDGKDKLHGLGFRGDSELFCNFNVNGPALFGCDGGVLGTTCDGEEIILSWNRFGKVGIGGITDPPQQLSIMDGIGFANHNAIDKKLYSPEDGMLEWMTHEAAAAPGLAVSHQGEKRVLLSTNGNSYIKKGKFGIGTDDPNETLDVAGNIRINDSTILLRKKDDKYHGLGYRGNPDIGEKPFAGFNVNGPALFGYTGGVLGTSWGGEKIILSWRNSGNVGIGINEPNDKLDVAGDIRINDSMLWLRGQTDKNHGLGWFGQGKLFDNKDIDGPALFGYSGGALGTHRDGDEIKEKIALSWDAQGNIGIGVDKPFGRLQIDNGTVIIGTPMGDAQSWADKLKWGGLYICQSPADGMKAVARLTLHNRGKDNKPHEWAFYTASYQGAWKVEPNALEIWEYKEGVAKQGVSRLKILPGGDTHLVPDGGKLKIHGDTRINDSMIWFRNEGDKNHGLGWFGAGQLFAKQNVDGPVLFGCSGGALGSHAGEDKISLTWDNQGNVTVAGDLNVGGKLLPQGLKGGFVADQFINNLGEALEEGDVIIIGSNQSSLYYGQNGSIPIPEVDLASASYDTKVCGIVCDVVKDSSQSAAQKTEDAALAELSKGKKKTRKTVSTEETEKITVAPGQKGYMVTLGAYAYCKVDAKYGAIEVGDLLTTSPTKGHAMKVSDPSKALGAIIGKALGSHKRGKGKIPVLVSLQ